MILNNNEAPTEVNQKCPFCHQELILKNDLLFCPKCDLFIGDPKTFTGSLKSQDRIKEEAIEREEERTGKKKGRITWQIIIILLMVIASFSIYQFKLWTFVVGIDYSSVKELQKEVPFAIYLPKKIPLGYNLEGDSTRVNNARSGKINSIDFVYNKIGGGIIKVSLFPIGDGYTQDNKTVGELFSNLSSGKNLTKASIGGQDIYTSESDITLTEKNTSVHNIIAITTSDNLMIKIEYTGSIPLTEYKLISIATSLRSVENL